MHLIFICLLILFVAAMGIEPIICAFPAPWSFPKQVTWLLTLSAACLASKLIYFLMLLNTPFKINLPVDKQRSNSKY